MLIIYFLLPRLHTLSGCSEDQSDLSDLELIQHLNVDVNRLTKLLGGRYTVAVAAAW